MKQTAVEWLQEQLKDVKYNPLEKNGYSNALERLYQKAKEIEKQQQGYSEEEMLKMLHKFGFDYTYNYKGEKTIYEWIPEWFGEYKRLKQLNKEVMKIKKLETRQPWLCEVDGTTYIRTEIQWNDDRPNDVTWHLNEDQVKGKACFTDEQLEKLFRENNVKVNKLSYEK